MTRPCAHCGLPLGRVWITICAHALCVACAAAGHRRALSHTCLCAEAETSGPLAPVVAAREKQQEAA